MKKTAKLNPYMFKLLIEKEMNNFSVIEIRNALMECDVVFADKEEARKFVYKQLLSLKNKGWLSTTGVHRRKRYLVTDNFRACSFEARAQRKVSSAIKSSVMVSKTFDIVLKEKKKYEGELAITLGEIEEYQSLAARFPQDKATILPLFDSAKDRSAKLLGKINALSNWIHATKGEVQTC
ncbi:hypothetical protein [Vibrio sp. CAU 1672]|uniref:hypothetical protein n=1 Tax=Vibrio sp. CAU 1672 TaxID=3032594 RepID=UPI0023DAFA9F|nr:hypothetical protein [Vibrio sp. CAU 1672]MDF2152882.1 hypothetical protein [Vibrio sp. CAU 1672]